MTLLHKLQKRGCIHDASHFDELAALLERERIAFYCGFDPTADSLHAGSMLPLCIMRRLQQAGHTPIVVLGSATGMIGDPSGKSEERKLLNEDDIARNATGIERQIATFLSSTGPNACKLVKNHEWLRNLNYIDFLRDIGKHFSVNMMISKESVKARLEAREQGISYTEFSYMLLQAYDYFWLNKHYNCRLQVGGSDQWGNITAGTDLIRKNAPDNHPPAYGLTFPLITTASGVKFGKTEQGTIWLDSNRTSPYRFYQYWLNTADADVIRYLQLFTEIEGDELAALEKAVQESPEQRLAQNTLAKQITSMVHGPEEMGRAGLASNILFGGRLTDIDSKTLLEIFSDVPATEVHAAEVITGIQLQDILVRCGLASSKGAARRLIEGGGLSINNEKTSDLHLKLTLPHFIDGKVLLLRSGKKNYHLIRLA